MILYNNSCESIDSSDISRSSASSNIGDSCDCSGSSDSSANNL